jgi:glycosyltransferase involved in cell wall biosynthesis
MKHKILYIIENSFFGGGERAFAQIINGLDKEKYEAYVACLPSGEFTERIKRSATIMPFDLRNRFDFTKIFQLVKIIKQKNIEIIHSQGSRADFFARIAARLTSVPAAVSTIAMPVEGFDVGSIKKIIYIVLDRFSERFVDRYIVVSEALRKRLIEKHKIPSKKIVKIYNGVEIDSDARRLMPDVRKKIMEELMIPENAMLAGTIGRLVWQKGLTYFIQAIKEINTRWKMQDVRYLIVGEGKERNNLEQIIKKLGLSDKIIFTGFCNDIKEILYSLDVFVLPSIREGQPIALLEAMAMETPIVATDIEGVNETIVDGITGILVPPKNPSALAEAIVCLLKDKKKAQEMGQAGRVVVEEKFNLKDKMEQHKRLYETIIVEKSGVY